MYLEKGVGDMSSHLVKHRRQAEARAGVAWAVIRLVCVERFVWVVYAPAAQELPAVALTAKPELETAQLERL